MSVGRWSLTGECSGEVKMEYTAAIVDQQRRARTFEARSDVQLFGFPSDRHRPRWDELQPGPPRR